MIAVQACDRSAATAVTAPIPVYKGTTADAQISRDGGRLRIRVKKRQHAAPVTFASTGLERGRGSAVAQGGTASLRVLPGTEVLLNETAPDTAIVKVSGSAGLKAASDYFDVTANLSASVLQGHSWYPLYRAANGYEVDLFVTGVNGSTPYGRADRCLVGTVWGTSQACIEYIGGHNAYSSATGTASYVGQACSYNARLHTVGIVGWYRNFDRVETNREMRQTEVHDFKSSELRRRCLPDITQLCDDPSYCSGSSSTGGPSAEVEGEVQWDFPGTESSAWTEVIVCEVTDWYIWTSAGWMYVETTIDYCWTERR